MSEVPRGWRHRDRLPHADFTGLTQAVTFRLADALPGEVLDRLHRQVAKEAPGTATEDRRNHLLRERLHDWLDAGHDSSVLRQDGVRRFLAEELHRHDGVMYRLDAYTLMPNHVHVLLGVDAVPLGKIMQAW
jgi:putative transposase